MTYDPHTPFEEEETATVHLLLFLQKCKNFIYLGKIRAVLIQVDF